MITISTEMGIAVIVTLTGCISFLFHALIRSKEAQIKLLQDQLAKSDQDKEHYHAGWVKTLSAANSVASVAARTIDYAERSNDP